MNKYSEVEKWKEIPEYEGYYEASTLGRIRSIPRTGTKGGILVGELVKGYPRYTLSKDGVRKPKLGHVLVATTWIPNPHNYKEIDHINTIRTDNRVSNLRWVDHTTNQRNPLTRAKLTGTNNPFYGKHHTEETKKKISENNSGRKYSDDVNKKKGRPGMTGKKSPCSKPVEQYSIEGDYIRSWDCIMDVVRETGWSEGNIGKCAQGKYKSAYGYIWKFKYNVI